MLISDAKKLIGQLVNVDYLDRSGKLLSELVEVFDVNFIALYGPCLITDIGDIRLDRVSRAEPAALERTA
jgi:hypothetical protein